MRWSYELVPTNVGRSVCARCGANITIVLPGKLAIELQGVAEVYVPYCPTCADSEGVQTPFILAADWEDVFYGTQHSQATE